MQPSLKALKPKFIFRFPATTMFITRNGLEFCGSDGKYLYFFLMGPYFLKNTFFNNQANIIIFTFT